MTYDIEGSKITCNIGIKGPDGEWVWKGDGAGDTQFEADKGAYSSSQKRAGRTWRIGAYLAEVPKAWVEYKAYQDHSKKWKFSEWLGDPWLTIKQLVGPKNLELYLPGGVPDDKPPFESDNKPPKADKPEPKKQETKGLGSKLVEEDKKKEAARAGASKNPLLAAIQGLKDGFPIWAISPDGKDKIAKLEGIAGKQRKSAEDYAFIAFTLCYVKVDLDKQAANEFLETITGLSWDGIRNSDSPVPKDAALKVINKFLNVGS